MKQLALHTIYQVFADWSRHLPSACVQGCSTCCSQSVTITAYEGEDILRYVMEAKLSPWFVEKLSQKCNHRPAVMTNNDFAAACLEGRDIDSFDLHSPSPCPFLEDHSCQIYPVRPFGCRLFISSQKCSARQPALVPDYYFEAATAVAQLIEHLGQNNYWGNMLDVLPALLDISEFEEIGKCIGQTRMITSRIATLTAKPLPGFLLSNDNNARVTKLLEDIFSARVQEKSLEDILNGR